MLTYAPTDTINEIRQEVIKRMIAPLHEDIEARIKSTTCCTEGNVYDKNGRSLCDAAVLGSIYRGMMKQGGGILPKDSSCVTESVMQLGSWLFPMMAEIQTHHNGNAQKCNLREKYRKHNKTLQDSIPDIVQQCLKSTHKEYMASQRSKIGVANHPETTAKLNYWKLT